MAKLSIGDAATEHSNNVVVYLIAEQIEAPLCKIGMTTNLPQRLRALRTASPMPLVVIHQWPMASQADARAFERWILERCTTKGFSRRSEWVRISPRVLLQLLMFETRLESLSDAIDRQHNRTMQLHRRFMRVAKKGNQDVYSRRVWDITMRLSVHIDQNTDRILTFIETIVKPLALAMGI